MSYSSTVLGFTPGAYYRLGDASGAAVDSSGNAHNGTYTGSPTLAQTGLLSGDAGTCVKFLTASSQYVTVADNANNDPGDTFTLMAWIKRVTLNASYNAIVGKGNTAATFFVAPDNTLALLKSQVSVIANSTGTIADTTSSHFVAVTKSGSTVHFYIDGTEGTGAVTNATCLTNTNPFTIGADSDGNVTPQPANFANLFIQEAATFPTALTSGNITTIYNAAAAAGGGSGFSNLLLRGVG